MDDFSNDVGSGGLDDYLGNTGGDSGTSEQQQSSSPVDTTTPYVAEKPPEQDSFNPAWKPLLSELPDYFHEKAKGHLKTWDDNYRRLESERNEYKEKYSPYEQYLTQPPEAIATGLNVLRLIQEDPRQLYALLTDHMKTNGIQYDGQVAPTQQVLPGEDPSESLEEDPRITELRRQNEQLNEKQNRIDEYIYNETLKRDIAQTEDLIDTQVRAVVTKYGQSVDAVDLVQRMGIQLQMGQEFNAEAAYADQMATFKRLYEAQTRGRNAPQLIPTTGTPAPSGDKPVEQMNEEERRSHFKHLLDIANSA